jgi:hypothetical protein
VLELELVVRDDVAVALVFAGTVNDVLPASNIVLPSMSVVQLTGVPPSAVSVTPGASE